MSMDRYSPNQNYMIIPNLTDPFVKAFIQNGTNESNATTQYKSMVISNIFKENVCNGTKLLIY